MTTFINPVDVLKSKIRWKLTIEVDGNTCLIVYIEINYKNKKI